MTIGQLFKSHSCATSSRLFERCNSRSANLPASRRDPERGGWSLQTCGVGQGFAYATGLRVAIMCGLSDLYVWDIADWQKITENEVEEAE